MQLGSRAVEELLGARHGIGEERRIAFRGRLEHLRRLGCPVGVQTGKGKPAVFGWKQIIEAAFALDLIDLGINPENAARVVIEHEQALCSAGVWLVAHSGVDVVAAVQERKWPVSQSILLDVGVHALSGLRNDGTPSSTSFGPVYGTYIMSWFEEQDAIESGHALVNLGALLANLANFALAWAGMDLGEIAIDLIAWGEDNYGLDS